MQDYTGTFEKIASDVVGYDYEDTSVVKEASITPGVSRHLQIKHERLNKNLKREIDMNANRASMKYNKLEPRSIRLRARASVGTAAQKAKPTGFFANTFRKVFGK